MDCYDEPDMVHILLEKATSFIIAYCKAYKEAGANGVVIAEPVAGLLSPGLSAEFSGPYVKQIVDAVQDDNFLAIYHNCGNAVLAMMDSILETGAAAYHFGNAIDMADVLERVPEDTIVMGNIDPAGEFRNGTTGIDLSGDAGAAQSVRIPQELCHFFRLYIPPLSKWENIDAFLPLYMIITHA